MSSWKCLKQWRTHPKVASLKAATGFHNINQPSISAISRTFATRSVSPSFAYSVGPDMIKGKLTMLGDWQNALHINMWELGKVLNATDCKDFLGAMFAEKPNSKFFLKLIDVDDSAGSWAESRLKKTPDD